MGAAGLVRVAFRLVALALLTAGTVAWLRVRALLGDRCPHAATRAGHRWARRMTRLLGVRLDVQGAPPDGPVLLLANHRSYIDIAVLLAQRPCAFLAKAEIGDWPLFGAAARETHTVFVRRDDRASRSAARGGALALLQRGVGFAAFPEGTTSRGPGLLPFFPGLFALAREHGFSVVPVAIEYSDRADAWVDDETFVGHFLACFRKPRVHVALAFGPPLDPREVDDLKGAAERWIAGRLEALSARAGAERYASAGMTWRPSRSIERITFS